MKRTFLLASIVTISLLGVGCNKNSNPDALEVINKEEPSTIQLQGECAKQATAFVEDYMPNLQKYSLINHYNKTRDRCYVEFSWSDGSSHNTYLMDAFEGTILAAYGTKYDASRNEERQYCAFFSGPCENDGPDEYNSARRRYMEIE